MKITRKRIKSSMLAIPLRDRFPNISNPMAVTDIYSPVSSPRLKEIGTP